MLSDWANRINCVYEMTVAGKLHQVSLLTDIKVLLLPTKLDKKNDSVRLKLLEESKAHPMVALESLTLTIIKYHKAKHCL